MAEQKVSAESGGIEAFGYKQELRRGLTLKDVILYGVLFMVIIAPQSIYGEIQQESGGMTPLVYIIGFIAISFTAMGYMHMSKRFPIAGSVYSYVQRGINPHVGFVAGWLILLDYIFVPSLLLVMVANWGVALIPGSPWYLWVLVFVAFNTIVNIRGITMQKGVDWVIFAIEILAVIAFIALGTNFILGGGGSGEFTMDPIYQPGKVDVHFIAAACSIACLSFLGFDGMSTLAEETEKPEKTIGKGIIICEIQQNSNTTYRVYDYGRLGKDGKPRELHVKKAIDVTNLEPVEKRPHLDVVMDIFADTQARLLASCEYFTVYELEIDGTSHLTAGKDSFQSFTVLDGSVQLHAGDAELTFKKGETSFLPAGLGAYTLTGKARLVLSKI